jgi:hypothetical protein
MQDTATTNPVVPFGADLAVPVPEQPAPLTGGGTYHSTYEDKKTQGGDTETHQTMDPDPGPA